MSRPKEIINEGLSNQAQEAMRQVRDYKVVVKLQAIVSSQSYPLREVAQIFGIGRQTLRNWILAFRSQGIAGLVDKPRGHRHSKLSDEQWAAMGRWLEAACSPDGQPCHWTLESLQQSIAAHWGVHLGITPLWRQVHKLGFTLKVPRPAHAKADPRLQADFKKNR